MMSLRKHLAGVALLALVASCVPAHAISFHMPHIPGMKKKDKDMALPGHKPTAAQNALIDKAIGREKETIKVISDRRPLIEVTIQEMKPDVALQQVPRADEHYVQRVHFTKLVGEEDYDIKTTAKKGIIKGTLDKVLNIQSAFKYHFNSVGFTRMIVMDSSKFDRQHYDFLFV